MKFRLNDHVRVIAHPSRLFDSVGTVTDVDPGARHQFRVEVLEGFPLWFGPDELVLAEVPG